MSSSHADLEKQAIVWLVRLQSQAYSEAVQHACLQWRQQHPGHEAAWQAVERSYQQLRHHIQQVPADLPVPASSLLQTRPAAPARRRALRQLGSALLLLAPVGWVVREYAPWQRLQADYATAVGQRTHVTLPDGAQLVLNTDSAVRLRPTAQAQDILLDRGEISLQHVSGSGTAAQRPWRIVTQDGQILLHDGHIGIRQDKQGSLTYLAAGRAQLQGKQMPEPVALPAGHDAVLSPGQLLALPPTGLDRLAWTDGLIVAHDLPLAEFLREVGRYRPGRLDWQPAVADWRISGTYQLDDTDRLLALLSRVLPVSVRQRTPYWVTVSART